MLQRLYEGQEAKVKTDASSNWFMIQRGTKQGDPISAIIFNAVVEHFMKILKAECGKKKFGVQVDQHTDNDFVTNLRYADDILLTARSLPQIKKMINEVAIEAGKVGLKLHPDKTKILHNNTGYGSRVRSARCGEMTIEVMDLHDSTTYLGSAINLNSLSDTEVDNRISKAWAKYGVFKKELNDQSIPLNLRLKLFDAVITPSILYASECWTLTSKRQTRIRTAQRRMMRLVTGAHRSYDDYEDHSSWMKDTTRDVEATMKTYGLKQWTKIQLGRTWKWAAKVAQAGGKWTHTLATWFAHGSRGVGKPKARWSDPINRFLTSHTLDRHEDNDWMKIAKDTNRWNNLLVDYIHFSDLDSHE